MELLLNPLPPNPMVSVPRDDLSEPFFQGNLGLPAQLVFDLAGIDSVPKIVPRPIRNEGNEGLRLIQQSKNETGYVQVRPARQPPNVVSLPKTAFVHEERGLGSGFLFAYESHTPDAHAHPAIHRCSRFEYRGDRRKRQTESRSQ